MEVSSSSVRSLFSLGFSFLVLHRLRGVAHCLPEERNKLPGFATYHDKDVVAEVDDPARNVNKVVVISNVEGSEGLCSNQGEITLPEFRTPPKLKMKGRKKVPCFTAKGLHNKRWQVIELNPENIALGPYIFRGWRYARFIGQIDLAAINLDYGE